LTNVPFFRPEIGEAEIEEVVATMRSGWLTSGPRVKRFETELAQFVGARHALALNSCTAALHLAIEALHVRPGDVVIVPTMTFAATAEVVRYLGAIPLLVDCDPRTLNIDFADAERKIADLRAGRLVLPDVPPDAPIVGVIPVHVGGYMVAVDEMKAFAKKHGLWLVEDAAHALPASWRADESSEWIRCGDDTSDIACYSFYANKTITTGEGGMATTPSAELAERMRLMSLHGLSLDAWARYSGGKVWDYKIVAPGFKYNLTDVAASIGIHQLARAEEMRVGRERVARRYFEELASIEEIELPADDPNRIHSWHLYPIRLRLERLSIDRNAFFDAMRDAGIGTSVHWRPLHLHPYYQATFGWTAAHCPVATREWERLISIPIFSAMTDAEFARVVEVIRSLCVEHARVPAATAR
jgi:dTDP-4-amino-4,6-dideoxygalactose transaminase